MDLQRGIQRWFYERASVPHYSYGMDRKKTKELKEHLKGCSTIWVSEPDFETIEMRGEYDHERTVPGIEAVVSCGCGRFKFATLFATHDATLIEVVTEVVAAGKDV